MGYFKDISIDLDQKKAGLCLTIEAAQNQLDSYFRDREPYLKKWDQEQYLLDDLQQDLYDILQKLKGKA